jgi:hypothetical protein
MTDATASDTAVSTDATFEAPSLGIQDIENALRVIDFACEQGAFKGWDTITKVQAVRGKLASFVNFAQTNTNGEASAQVAE